MVSVTCSECGRVVMVANGRGLTAKFCSKACMGRGTRVPICERFWSKVQKTDSCWLWTAAVDVNGYGRVGTTRRRTALAHRVAYELVKGPVPDGLTLDHLCRTHRCVNPDHLESVTARENIIRAGLVALRVCRSGRHQLSAESIVTNGAAVTCALCRREARIARARRRGVRTKEEYWASMRGIAPRMGK